MRERGDAGHRRAGLSPGQEKAFHIVAGVVGVLFLGAWSYAIAVAAEGSVPVRFAERLTVSPLSSEAPPEAAVLTDLAVRALAGVRVYRGESGALNVAVLEEGDTLVLTDTLPTGAMVEYAPADSAAPPAGAEGSAESGEADRGGPPPPAPRPGPEATPPGGTPAERGGARAEPHQPSAPEEPGIWSVLLREGRALYRLPDFSVVTLVPTERLKGGRIGSYLIGSWPGRGERPARFRDPSYDPPRGLIRVTPENRDTRVSEHFTLGDFLTKGQKDVWPKYVAMSVRLLDKLELTVQELEEMGHPVRDVGVISGFRTPRYNETGGDPSGRGTFSRHMYGDAMDLYIDNDGDGRMDDLNGDGKVDIGDARVLAEAADRVEREHPNLVGGIGTYAPTGAHSGFVHIDTRGYRARW